MSHYIASFGSASLIAILALPGGAFSQEKPAEASKDLLAELQSYPHKLVYETNRDGNWECISARGRLRSRHLNQQQGRWMSFIRSVAGWEQDLFVRRRGHG